MKKELAISAAGLALTGVLSGATENYAGATSKDSSLSKICSTQQSTKAFEKSLNAASLGLKDATFKKSEPYKGIQYLQWRTEKPKLAIHTLVVDLDAPGIDLKATPPSKNMRTVSAYGEWAGVEAAINGDLYRINSDGRPLTLAVGDGKKWPGTKDNTSYSTIQFDENNCVEITEKRKIATFQKGMDGAVGGHPLLLWNGKIDSFNRNAHPSCGTPQPRTAVGLSEDKRTLFMTVIDGRRPESWSKGMTCTETAKIMQKLGAHTALNLDGGGSSAMWLKNQGLVNKPSGSKERAVANHLGVDAIPNS